MRCVSGEGEACADEAAECAAIEGCSELAACMETCVAVGDCPENCCEGATPDAVEAAVELHACRVEVCVMLCSDSAPARE